MHTKESEGSTLRTSNMPIGIVTHLSVIKELLGVLIIKHRIVSREHQNLLPSPVLIKTKILVLPMYWYLLLPL